MIIGMDLCHLFNIQLDLLLCDHIQHCALYRIYELILLNSFIKVFDADNKYHDIFVQFSNFLLL